MHILSQTVADDCYRLHIVINKLDILGAGEEPNSSSHLTSPFDGSYGNILGKGVDLSTEVGVTIFYWNDATICPYGDDNNPPLCIFCLRP